MRKSSKVLLLVDVQPTFMPGGGLAVAGGDEIVDPIAGMLAVSPCTVATQDWHPADHGSFASQYEGKSPMEFVELGGVEQILWPDHGVQGTEEAAIHPRINLELVDAIVQKGTIRDVDSYSGFFDNAKKNQTALDGALKQIGADTLYVCGLATDFCVKFTVLDAIELGYKVKVVADACRAVIDHDAAIKEMQEAGAEIITADQAKAELAA